jgi:N-acetylglucosamine-6-phosphate deacetylase
MSKMKKNVINSFAIEGFHYETAKPVRIEITDGMIRSINESPGPHDEDKKLFVAPGLIDNQINGFAGIDFSGNSLSADGVIKAAQALWKVGVTSFLPTLLTNSNANLLKIFGILDEAISNNHFLQESIPGFHLEGPYISAEEGYRGCHPVRHIRKPSREELASYQQAAGGRIIQITMAPEIEGAMEFIRLCVNDGIVVAIGHTNASASQIGQAVENGARLSTHLGNGCANFIHRHKNPIWPQLSNDMLTPSVIADGQHLLPDEIRVFYKVKGSDNMILTSDVVYLAGMAPGKYTFLESEVILTQDGMLLNQELDCLAGASFPLIKGVENIMIFTGCSLADAINMASGNVAEAYNLHDRGKLNPGRRADIIMFERMGNQLKINQTFQGGKLVYKA